MNALDAVYCGHTEYQGNDEWGKFLYFQLNKNISETLLRQLRTHAWYKTELDPDSKSILFVFEPDIETKLLILKPFLDGKYSQIDRAYVKNNFTQYLSNGNESTNWMILNKSDNLRRAWEQAIGVKFTDDMEVYSKPVKEKEIFGFVKTES